MHAYGSAMPTPSEVTHVFKLLVISYYKLLALLKVKCAQNTPSQGFIICTNTPDSVGNESTVQHVKHLEWSTDLFNPAQFWKQLAASGHCAL